MSPRSETLKQNWVQHCHHVFCLFFISFHLICLYNLPLSTLYVYPSLLFISSSPRCRSDAIENKYPRAPFTAHVSKGKKKNPSLTMSDHLLFGERGGTERESAKKEKVRRRQKDGIDWGNEKIWERARQEDIDALWGFSTICFMKEIYLHTLLTSPGECVKLVCAHEQKVYVCVCSCFLHSGFRHQPYLSLRINAT